MSTHNKYPHSGTRPLLCYVTDRKSLVPGDDLPSVDLLLREIDVVAAAGVDWIQIREKDLSAKDLASVVRAAVCSAKRHSTGAHSTRILVNDRLDVAIAEQAHGVHLGEKSLAPADAKRLIQSAISRGTLPQNFLLGLSCHSLHAALAAASAGADYLIFGPIFPTPSKAQYGKPQGLERLTEVCRATSIPIIAIGGITLENAKSCLAAGAAGLAAIRFFQDAADPTVVVRMLYQLRSTAPSE